MTGFAPERHGHSTIYQPIVSVKGNTFSNGVEDSGLEDLKTSFEFQDQY